MKEVTPESLMEKHQEAWRLKLESLQTGEEDRIVFARETKIAGLMQQTKTKT